MNKHVHRLVFDRRRGMRVPAHEHARSAGKAAGGQTRAVVLVGALSLLAATEGAVAQLRADGAVEGVPVTRDQGAMSMTPAARPVSELVRSALELTRPNLPKYSEGRWSLNSAPIDLKYSDDGKILTLTQTGATIVLNWDSFDIASGYTVRFSQTNGGRALNRVHNLTSSVINGVLTANGEIIIENTAGVVFGSNARVDTRSMVATALKVSDAAFEAGIRSFRKGEAAFGGDNTAINGFVSVERGAQIRSLPGGDVILVAPRVVNQGLIETPQGQAILAAGKTVYLYAPLDLAQRGLLVAIDNFDEATLAKAPDLGSVENARANGDANSGTIRADKGTINLVGAAIRQKGTLTATTAVKGQNGAIFLTAMKDTVTRTPENDKVALVRVANNTGTIELAQGSVTEVLPSVEGLVLSKEQVEAGKIGVSPDEVMRVREKPVAPKVLASTATAAEKAKFTADKAAYEADLKGYEALLQQASDTFYRSRIDIIGKEITLRAGSAVQAPAGEVNILATSNWATSPLNNSQSALGKDDSRFVMEAGARVDVSGLNDLKLPASRNQLQGRLFSIELADSPLQRDGVIYRADLLADARRRITIGDATGLYSDIRYSAAEYSTAGGMLRMQAQGGMLLDAGASIDFSGGKVTYDAGTLVSSLLLRNGAVTRIEDASKDLRYSEMISDPSRANEDDLVRLGLADPGVTAPSVLESQTVGMSAGVALLSAPVMSLGATLNGSVTMSEVQRLSTDVAERDRAFNTSITLGAMTDSARVINRSAALTAQPHLYAALKPTAGLLVLGQHYGTVSNGVEERTVQSSIQVTSGGLSLPALPSAWTTEGWQQTMAQVGTDLKVSAALINAAGLAGLKLQADTVTIGSGLNLASGGSFEANAFSGVQVDGRIASAGGAISLLARRAGADVVLGSTASLDAAGTVRDERVSAAPANEGVARKGGTVTLQAARSVLAATGSDIDVSGAAWRSSGGAYVQGTAGELSISVNQQYDKTNTPTGTLSLGSTLRAYDFSAGGTLTLKGIPALVIGGTRKDALSIGSNLFADRGFGKLDVTTIGHIDIASGALVQPTLVNMVPTAARLAGLTAQPYELTVLETGRRQPFSLTLKAEALPGTTKADTTVDLPNGANLTVGQGALVDVGIGGAINLSAGGSIEVDGTLKALAGNVSLSLLGARGAAATDNTAYEPQGYLKGQRIHLDNDALIDVSGAVKSYLADGDLAAFLGFGQREVGEVLAGGTVTLGGGDGTPTRGQLIMDKDATIRLKGASGLLDRSALPGKTLISAGAGTLNIMSTDGFQLLGKVEAAAPNASVSGGTINIALSQQGLVDRTDPALVKDGVEFKKYPEGQRNIRITGSQAQAKTLAESGLGFGEGVVSAELLNTSGFDRIQLRADQSVQLNAGANLVAGDNRTRLQSVVLNASVIDVADGAGHTIQAHQVSVGPKGKVGDALPVALPQVTAASKRAAAGDLGGAGSLEVQAGLIEVVGDTAVLGTDKLTLNATLSPVAAASLGRTNGEIRFVGQSSASNAALKGQLSFSGELNLMAGQVYATTLSNFSVKGYDKAGADMSGTLNILAPSAGISSSQTPLSALAALSLRANSVTMDGTVRQPFGRIDVEANSLTLTGRADLSVSGDGTKVPVGTTLNQTQWVYGTQGTVTTTGTAANIAPKDNATAIDLSQLPLNKQITLNGKAQLKIDSQSAVDVRAGGDIVASEFKPGVGGTTDTYLRKNVFAVLPNYSYDFAPTDADIGATAQKVGSTLKAGDQITIATDNGVLKAGTYTLMDARYGILPGAVLVSATNLPVTAPLPVAVQNDDGSVIVSGHRKATGTAQNGGGDQRLALTLEPEATFRKKSEVILTSGNAYQQQQSVRSGNTLFNPGDAGRVSLLSEKAFDWAARFNFSGKAQEGLSAGQFDLSMLNMVVQADASQAVPEGAKSVSMAQLNALGADSVLLGGKRTTLANGSIKVKRTADNVTFQADVDANGVPVTGAADAPRNLLRTEGEILTVAKQQVTVENGLTLVSTGADTGASRRYVIEGDGAALQVGRLSNTDISVTGVTGEAQGNLTVGRSDAASSVKLKGNSVQLDSTNVLSVAQSTELATRSLSLGGKRVAVGAESSDVLDTSTLSVSGKLLTAANSADRLKLRSYTSIDFYRSVALGSDQMTRLSLDAPQLLGQGADTDTALVRARDVVLANSSGREAPTRQVMENGKAVTKAEEGKSSLVVSATPVLRDGKTGGLTIGTSLTSEQSVKAQAGQLLAFGKGTTLQSAGDIVFSGRGQTATQGDLTLRAARVTADSTSDQTVAAKGALNIEKAPGGKTLNESLGAGGRVALNGATVNQAGVIDIEAGRVSLTGAGQAGQSDTVKFAAGSETRVDGRTRQVSGDYAVASGGGQITATASAGSVVVDGLLSAAAGNIPTGLKGDAPYAGTVSLKAADAVVVGGSAVISLDATSGKGGNLVVDAGKLQLGTSADAAVAANAQIAQNGLDRLMDISRNASGTGHRAVDVRVRADDLSLNTSVKAAMVALTSDSGKVTLGSHAKIDATVLQGGVVQLQAKGDVTLQTGAEVLAQSTRVGANGGDVLLSSTDGEVLLGKVKVKADSEGDAADGRIVIRAGQTQDGAGAYTGDVNVGLLPAGASDAADAKLTLDAGQIEIEAVRVYKDAVGTAANAQRNSLIAGASSGQAWGLTTLVEDAATFATEDNKNRVLSNLGLTGRTQAHVKAGVEVQTLGDLKIGTGTDITLNTQRPGAEPITLTVRAAGDINVNSTVSDGFTVASGILSTTAGDATSMRFVAGADTSSAKLSATQSDASKGHFTLAGGKFIRTTAGSIDVNASGDVRLMAPTLATSSAIYVAGRTAAALPSNERFTSNAYANARFTERGGRLTVAAGGNVGSYFLDSANANALTQQQVAQMTGNYFYHGGAGNVPVAWWTGLNAFRQGFGSFGGGNVSVAAGGDVSNLAVVAPTNARTVQILDASGKVLRTELKELNGGDVEVLAGGNIDGGVYFLGRGQGRIAAGGSLNRGADQVSDKILDDGTIARPNSTVVYEPGAMLGLMNGTWDVSARKDVNVSYVFNPTALPFRTNGQSPFNESNISNAASGLNASNASVYFTYAADAGVTLTSLQGNVNWETNAQAINLLHKPGFAETANAAAGIGLVVKGSPASTLGSLASVAPPVVSINSLQGHVLINTVGRALADENGTTPSTNGLAVQPLYVMPTLLSDVKIHAAKDLLLQGNLQLLDATQAQLGLPSRTKPALVAGTDATLTSNNIAALNTSLQPGSSAATNSANGLRVSSDLDSLTANTISDLAQAGNTKVVRVHAGRDIVFDTKTDDGIVVDPFLRSNRPMELVAGRDVVNPAIIGQNFTEADVTRIAAGRDITGGITASSQILLGGPGALRVEAGRDINLNQSLGVVAVGNEINTALPEQSAKITLSAGNERTVNVPKLVAQHGANPALRLAMNAALKASMLPLPDGFDSWAALSFDAAMVAFSGLTDSRQVAAVNEYLNAVFVARYLPDQAGQSSEYYRSEAFLRLKQEAMWKEAVSLAGQAVAIAVSSNAAEEATRAAQRKALFAQAAGVVDLAGLGASFNRSGDINLSKAKVHNLGLGGGSRLGQVDNSLGGIDLVAAGQVTAGLPSADAKKPGGFINFQGGSFRSLTGGDFLAEDQKVIVVGRGNLYIYTLDGSIDSGKGSNTSAAKPLPARVFDATTGRVITQGQPPTSGSGFQAVEAPSDVETVIGLYAPNGEIRALDAFIKGSKVELAAPKVVGADNIANASGATAPPPPTVSLSLTPKVADTAAGVAQAADAGDARARDKSSSSMLTVELLGFGDGSATAAGAAEPSKDKDKDKDKDKEKR